MLLLKGCREFRARHPTTGPHLYPGGMSNLPPPPPPPPPGRGQAGGGPQRNPFERPSSNGSNGNNNNNNDRRPNQQPGETPRRQGFPRWALYVLAAVLAIGLLVPSMWPRDN